jgi:protein-L-isoaspartate O-methyltransferase
LLLSVTSAGQIIPAAPPPYFVIVDRALRDDGTSYHYIPPSEYAEANPHLVAMAAEALKGANQHDIVGPSWTTDAPFRIQHHSDKAVKPGMQVIDLCSGDCWFTLQIAKVARHVIAIDIDPNLLEVARHRLTESGVANCDFVAGDAYELTKLVPGRADFAASPAQQP